MFVGTCSDAGKSVINTAFCRIFRQDGYHPAPFKAQNMSLNSFVTPEGGEMGRAQVVQAEACGLLPHTDMNPILLKPSGDTGSQLIVDGRVEGNKSAREYFASSKTELFQQAIAAYRRLEQNYNPMVLEGAGSISELNLRDRDITNMKVAREVGAATYLVADISRGGVFASVYGSVSLLPEGDRQLIKGVIINKFRGDVSLFEEGKEILYQLTGVPVVGVVPWFKDICIEEEDSVALCRRENTARGGKINIAVVLLPHISNFTDFNALEQDDRFHLYYTDHPEEVEKAEIVILPGTKNTIADLAEIRDSGLAAAIMRFYHSGRQVIGICGGYQMMGRSIEDPLHVESSIEKIAGLGIFPQITRMSEEKTTCQRKFHFAFSPDECEGYEIHMGETVVAEGEEEWPLITLEDGRKEGYYLSEKCWGTYMHGIFDNVCVRDGLCGGMVKSGDTEENYVQFRQRQYDLLAAHVRKNVDLDYIYSTLQLPD